jgi:hypothetical protein
LTIGPIQAAILAAPVGTRLSLASTFLPAGTKPALANPARRGKSKAHRPDNAHYLHNPHDHTTLT